MTSNTIKTIGSAGHVLVDGDFDVTFYRECNDAICDLIADTSIDSITIDFTSATAIDTTGLGMLLDFQFRADFYSKPLKLANCKGSVKAMLDIANHYNTFSTWQS